MGWSVLPYTSPRSPKNIKRCEFDYWSGQAVGFLGFGFNPQWVVKRRQQNDIFTSVFLSKINFKNIPQVRIKKTTTMEPKGEEIAEQELGPWEHSTNKSNRSRNFWAEEISEFETLKRLTENKWNTYPDRSRQNSWI